MDLLITADQVRSRMALAKGLTENTATLESAIKGAQLHIAALLETDLGLTETAKAEIFNLDPEAHNGITPGGFYRLRLTRGHLRALPAVEVALGASADGPFVVLPSSSYRIDPEQGIVRVKDAHGGGYVQVTYYAGYEAGDDLPDWLVEAITAYVPVLFSLGPSSELSKEAAQAYKASGEHAAAVASLHMRSRSLVLRPL
jgi:hypothetical protein